MFKSFLFIIIFTGGLMSLLFLSGCDEKDSKKEKDISLNTAREEAKDVIIKYSVGGKRKTFLTGPIMYRVQDTVSYIEFPRSIHVDFYNEGDSIDSKLDARYAKYKDNQSIVYLKDSVKVVNTKGDTLYCDELYWDRARTGVEFYTEKPVRIRTKTHIINGIGMEARQDFKEWHIVQSTGFITVPNSQFPN
jgi:LPS export ABC transporter protein LptC